MQGRILANPDSSLRCPGTLSTVNGSSIMPCLYSLPGIAQQHHNCQTCCLLLPSRLTLNHEWTSPCRAALARAKGWAPRPLPASKAPLPQGQLTNAAGTHLISTDSQLEGAAASGAAMQPLPWSDPSLRFSSAPVVDNSQATEGFQTISVVVPDAPASNEGMGHGHAQQTEQVWGALSGILCNQLLVMCYGACMTTCMHCACPCSSARVEHSCSSWQLANTCCVLLYSCGLAYWATTEPLCHLPGLIVPFSQLNLLQGLQFRELPAEPISDDCAQTNWEARAIFNRSSSSNHAELVALGDGSQAEWEARACWDLPSRRASRDVPFIRASQELPSRRASQDLQGSAVNQYETYQETTAVSAESAVSAGLPNTSQGDIQQAGVGADTPSQFTSNGDQQQRLAKQTAAAAALQKALSNIQDIATGSQQARAAAAATAQTAAEAKADPLSQTLQQDAELFHGHSQAAADANASQDSGHAAMMDVRTIVQSMAGPEDSSHNQMGMAVDFLSAPVSAAVQLDEEPAAAVCSLAEESSSNGSHFSLDVDSSPDQTLDMASFTAHAAAQAFTARMTVQDSVRDTDAEQVASASLRFAQPIPPARSRHYLADPPVALSEAALSEALIESGSATQADLVLGPQPQAALHSQPSSSAHLPAESAGIPGVEQLEREMRPVQIPAWHHSSETAATGDSSALLGMQATAQQGTADRHTPDAIVQGGQVQPVSDTPPETVGWSGERSPPNAALQPSQGPSTISTPSNVLFLGKWSPPQAAAPPVLLSSNGDQLQQLPEPSSGEGHTLDRAEMVAHDSDMAWRKQQVDDGQTRLGNSLGEDAHSTYATDTMTLTPQVAAYKMLNTIIPTFRSALTTWQFACRCALNPAGLSLCAIFLSHHISCSIRSFLAVQVATACVAEAWQLHDLC